MEYIALRNFNTVRKHKYLRGTNRRLDTSFEVGKFISVPSLEELNTLKKAELLQLVNHYELAVSSSMPKSQIKKIVVEHLVDEEIIPSLEDTEEILQGERALTGEEVLQLRHLELEEHEKKARS